MDDGETQEGHDPEAAKPQQWRDGLASGGSSRGSEACAAAQPTTGGGSRWSRRRWIWWLEQEDQRLKKHDGRWIDIQRLRLLESFVVIFNRQKKSCICVNLIGPQVRPFPIFFKYLYIAHCNFLCNLLQSVSFRWPGPGLKILTKFRIFLWVPNYF